jgi:MatE
VWVCASPRHNVYDHSQQVSPSFFASFLGPAEVSAWGILGTLWDALELVTEAVADAAEVRTAYLLGKGKPAKAKLSAYKAIFLGFFLSLFVSSLMLIGGEDVPAWIATDSTLQRMVAELIPLFCIGNIALTVGTISWTLVGAQGRYRLSTAVGFSGAWFVTIPLAAIFTLGLKIDLQGQCAAMVIGYMVSGTVNTYVLLLSDWPKLSRRVIEQADEANRHLAGNDSSSSSSSSSSSRASDSDDGADKLHATDLDPDYLAKRGATPDETTMTKSKREQAKPGCSPRGTQIDQVAGDGAMPRTIAGSESRPATEGISATFESMAKSLACFEDLAPSSP